MAGYNSKFTGQQVDSLLEKAGSSYQKPETGIPQSDLAESTQQILQNVENKVNKEEGKGLSTNDFTDEYKAKVEDSASQEGYFPKMSVGIAANLAGRGEATEQVFTYRPTDGGTSIESGVAKIRRIKGNSVVFNQLVDGSAYSNTQTRYGLQCSITLNSREIRVVGTYVGDTSTPDRNWYNAGALTYYSTGIVGHKYLCHISGNKECSLTVYGWCSNPTDIFDSIIKECTSAQQLTMALKLPLVADGTQIDETIIIDIHDLTQMFGAGNEPTTVEEFRALYPNSYYPYNPGELRNLDCSGIKTVGFNQWDEQWKVGQISSTNGNVVSGGNKTISKNYIPVLPNTSYYLTLPLPQDDSHGVYYYDGNKNYIGYLWIAKDVNQKLFTTPSNCLFIKFDSWGTTYNNNICINLHHTGWRDGDYEPYKEITHALPLSQITNGEPLRKAGSVYDEINETHYIKRVGVVDLGSLNWSIYTPSTDVYCADIPTLGFVKDFISNSNLLSTVFTPAGLHDVINDAERNNIYSSHPNYNTLYVRASGYDNEYSFKSAMSGVLLNYELAEPIVTPIETSLNLDYQAEDFGTEEALLAEDSAPFSADIVYQFNAVDRIRENSLDIEDLLARVIALENAAATTTSIPDITEQTIL